MSTNHLDLVGTVDAARILGLTRGAITRRVSLGQLEPVAVIGKRGTLVFDRTELEAMAREEIRAREAAL